MTLRLGSSICKENLQLKSSGPSGRGLSVQTRSRGWVLEARGQGWHASGMLTILA